MNGARTSSVRAEAVERYRTRIVSHLARLTEGHDPMGHLFAIERLARAARAERWESTRLPRGGSPKP